MITGNLIVIPDARVRNIISKGPKYRFPSNIDFPKCRNEISASLDGFSYRWCKRKNVEPDALKEWKIIIFKIIDTRIMSPPFRVGRHIVFPQASVCLSVCLSVCHKSCSLYDLKTP